LITSQMKNYIRSLRPTRLDLGIFLISFAVLLVELLLTRIFSVTLYYHLSFMVVSLAMLGLGASGLIVNLWPSRFRRDRIWSQLAWAAILFGVTTVVAVGVAFHLRVSLELTGENWLRVGLIYGLCAIPFLAGGLVVALILTHHAEQTNRLYFFDLLGAALGCVAFIPATNWLGAPTAVLAGAAVATLSAVVLAGKEARLPRRVAIVLGCMAVIAAVANNIVRRPFFDVRVIKGERQPLMLALKWNSFSRVEVVGAPTTMWTPVPPFFPGFSKTLDPEFKIPEVWLRYDADAATQITRFDGDASRLLHLRHDVTSAPHQMRQQRNVLVIGPGGGRDILIALHFGGGSVTGVEINPITIDLMRNQFHAFTGGLYNNYPGVHVVNDEGRSFVRHATAQYDLIQASLVDTWAASAAGAHALTENHLYTVEAFEDYLRRLTPDGVIAFSRWFGQPPVESLRVAALAAEALRRQGMTDPASQVFVVRTNPDDTKLPSLGAILVRRSPFTPDELARLRTWAAQMRFLVDYAPDDLSLGVKPGEFHQLLGPDSSQFIANYWSDISTVYDDRPFFFNRAPLFTWMAHRLGLPAAKSGEGELDQGGQTLLISLIVTAACTMLLLFLPLIAARWGDGAEQTPTLAGVGRKRAALWALYFAGLGLGFIMVEIVLIQRFHLFLGYPVYSLSVVLFTVLLASAIGSFMADKWSQPHHSARMLPRILALLCGVLALYALALPRLLDAALSASTPVRIIVAVAVVAPLGLLMGMPFPTGLRRAGREANGLIPWAWAVNGAASVFGSTLTMLISMTYGFTASFLAGAAAYAVALGVAIGMTWPRATVKAAAVSNQLTS
jgi:SAM-dependent methyltransferase